MRNITVSVDDDTYRRARMMAAEQDTSVSALVRQFLADMARAETEAERLKREEAELRALVTSFRASDRLLRGELHDRGH